MKYIALVGILFLSACDSPPVDGVVVEIPDHISEYQAYEYLESKNYFGCRRGMVQSQLVGFCPL